MTRAEQKLEESKRDLIRAAENRGEVVQRREHGKTKWVDKPFWEPNYLWSKYEYRVKSS